MDKINRMKNNNLKIEGTNKMKKEQFSFDISTDKILEKLAMRAEREVPEYGSFASVTERFANKDNSYLAREVILRVRSLPMELKETTPDYNTARWLEAVVVGPYGEEAASIIKRGTKEEIMKTLSSAELNKKVLAKVKSLSKDLRAL